MERFVEGMREMKSYIDIEYFRWKRSYHHFIYELLVFTPNPETLDEEQERRNTYGAGPLGTKIQEEEPLDFKGRNYNP